MMPTKRGGLAFHSSILTSRQLHDADCTRAPTVLAIGSRIAEVGDAERIAALIRELAAKFILCDFSVEGKSRFLSDHTSKAVVDRIRTRFRYRVAEFDGELVAVIGVRDWAHLSHLFVAEAFQGQGLGRALWEQAKAECLERGNPGTFTVNSAKTAVPVYERFGFVATGSVQDMGGVQFVPMKLDALHTVDDRSSAVPTL
jgi:GNAT superfamily N-acetyltransferase